MNLLRVGKQGLFDTLINAEVAIKAIPDEESKTAARFLISRKRRDKPYSNNSGSSMSMNPTQKHDHLALNRIKTKLSDNEALFMQS